MQDGGINKLGEGDLEVACMKERMGEDVEKSHSDSNVDNIMNAVTWRAVMYTGNQLSYWSTNGPSFPCFFLSFKNLRGHS